MLGPFSRMLVYDFFPLSLGYVISDLSFHLMKFVLSQTKYYLLNPIRFVPLLIYCILLSGHYCRLKGSFRIAVMFLFW